LSQPLKIAPATLAKLAKLGIHHRADLLLHLPLRYEDETHLTPIANALPGEMVQVQGEVTHCEVMFRPRRTLVCRIQQGDEELILRFLNFYPSQQKQLAVGKTIRAIGEVRRFHPLVLEVEDVARAQPENIAVQLQHAAHLAVGRGARELPPHQPATDDCEADCLHR